MAVSEAPPYRIARLTSDQAEAFLAFRAKGLCADPESFRVTAADDDALGLQAWRDRLDHNYVVGALDGERIIGVGGMSRLVGEKLDHKALVWGMYVIRETRGGGVADGILTALIEHARGRVRLLQLTVMADNARARAFYERHGFQLYASEPQAVRIGPEYRDEALMWRSLVAD